jgi:hypothetical protein
MADTQNPVYTDNISVTGDGTEEHPLVATGAGATVTADGVTITGNGSAGNPLVAESGLINKTITLTSAQLLALSATEVALIPAPGAGKFINIISGTVSYHFGGTAYIVGGADIEFGYGTLAEITSNPFYEFAAGGFLDQAASQLMTSNAFFSDAEEDIVPITEVVNLPFAVISNTALTTGNGTMTVDIVYQILPIS